MRATRRGRATNDQHHWRVRSTGISVFLLSVLAIHEAPVILDLIVPLFLRKVMDVCFSFWPKEHIR